jgi:hypothetical protein
MGGLLESSGSLRSCQGGEVGEVWGCVIRKACSGGGDLLCGV